MKTFATIMKVLAIIAAIAGVVYVVATYGEQIAAWARKLLDRVNEFFSFKEAEFVPASELATTDGAVQAEEADFEG